MPTAQRSTEEFVDDGSWDLEIPLDSPDRFGIQDIARELGRDPANMRRRARALGCLLELRYLVDPQGRRQEQLATDEHGRGLLRRWYAR